MTDFKQAANTLRSRFKMEYHNRRSDPIAFDNVEGLIDTNGNIVQEATDNNGNPRPWVRFSIRPGAAQQQSLGAPGSRRFRQTGVVICQIFVPTGQGDGSAHEIADDIAASLRGVTDSGVRLRATTPPQFVGPDGAWWQANSTTEFEFDLTD